MTLNIILANTSRVHNTLTTFGLVNILTPLRPILLTPCGYSSRCSCLYLLQLAGPSPPAPEGW